MVIKLAEIMLWLFPMLFIFHDFEEEHQDRLSKYPNDYCHIPKELLTKYRK